jgi:hypothetical protein
LRHRFAIQSKEKCATPKTSASQLNLSAAKPRFAYLTQTFNFAGQGDDAQSDPATFNAFSSSLLGQGQFTAVNRNQSIKLPIGVDATEFAITPAKGLMVLELENSPGTSQADLLSLRAFGQ